MSPRLVSVTAMRRLSVPEPQRRLDDRPPLRAPGGVAHHHEAVHGGAHAMRQAAAAAARHRDLQDRAAVRAAGGVDGPHPRHVQRARPRAGVDLRLEAIDVQARAARRTRPSRRASCRRCARRLAAASAGGRLGRRADARGSGNQHEQRRPGAHRTRRAAASTTRAFARVATIDGGPGSVGTTRPSGARACTVSPGRDVGLQEAVDGGADAHRPRRRPPARRRWRPAAAPPRPPGPARRRAAITARAARARLSAARASPAADSWTPGMRGRGRRREQPVRLGRRREHRRRAAAAGQPPHARIAQPAVHDDRPAPAAPRNAEHDQRARADDDVGEERERVARGPLAGGVARKPPRTPGPARPRQPARPAAAPARSPRCPSAPPDRGRRPAARPPAPPSSRRRGPRRRR